MKIPCLSCNTETNLEVTFEVKTFVCPSCRTVYFATKDNDFKYSEKFRATENEPDFVIGQKATFDNQEYVVTGILLKKAYDGFHWREYVLQGSNDTFIYLSEADGHWILLEQIDNELVTDVKFEKDVKKYNNIECNLYARNSLEIESALGFFDFNLSKTKTRSIEYINPPYLISIENSHNSTDTFFGKHVSKADIKKAFQTKNVPSKTGVGLVQPFVFNLKNLALVFCSIAILILLSHYFLNRNQKEKEVLNKSISFENYNNKEIITPSFELVGSSAPLSITVHSNVDNSWANAQIGLINEKTGEERFASKDVEYYHGYTDGESWAEGDPSEEFNFCGVKSGTYHLVILPSKDSNDVTNNSLQVKAVWSKPSMRNFWMTVLFMAVFWVAIYFLNREFEKRRWKDSDYSPYYIDEE